MNLKVENEDSKNKKQKPSKKIISLKLVDSSVLKRLDLMLHCLSTTDLKQIRTWTVKKQRPGGTELLSLQRKKQSL